MGQMEFKLEDTPEERKLVRQPGRLMTPQEVKDFMFAGNATITLVSITTKNRFTYRIKAAKPMADGKDGPASHFVALMNGPDNEGDFKYIGHFFRKSGDYMHGRNAKVHEGAPSSIAFKWFTGVLESGGIPETLEIWHEGRCGRCGRKLTVPSSIKNGIGPECIKHI